jgi:hypothetical protein
MNTTREGASIFFQNQQQEKTLVKSGEIYVIYALAQTVVSIF